MPYFVFVSVVGSRKSGNCQLTLLKGYGKYYEKKYKKPLPVDVIVKIWNSSCTVLNAAAPNYR